MRAAGSWPAVPWQPAHSGLDLVHSSRRPRAHGSSWSFELRLKVGGTETGALVTDDAASLISSLIPDREADPEMADAGPARGRNPQRVANPAALRARLCLGGFIGNA